MTRHASCVASLSYVHVRVTPLPLGTYAGASSTTSDGTMAGVTMAVLL